MAKSDTVVIFEQGQRVVFTQLHDLAYPLEGMIPAGTLGTVTQVDDDAVWVKPDDLEIPDLEEWDYAVQLWDFDEPDVLLEIVPKEETE